NVLQNIEQGMNRRMAKFGISRVGELAIRRNLVAQRTFRPKRELILRRLAIDKKPRAMGIRRGRLCAGAIALFTDHKYKPKFRMPAASSLCAVVTIAAMMPFASQAPRPKMNSSSSLELKKGGTVSMCVESVTTGSPQEAKRLSRFASAGMRWTCPPLRPA